MSGWYPCHCCEGDGGSYAPGAPDHVKEIATLRAALDGLTAEDLWLGVEISAIGILTFAEPMVSVAGARAAIRAHLATMNEAGNG